MEHEHDPDETNMSPEDEAALNEVVAAAKTQPTNPLTSTVAAQNANLKSITEIEFNLSKPIPPRLLLKFDKGSARGLTYIHWLTAQKFLSLYAPGWSSRVITTTDVGDGVVVNVEISIPTLEGLVTRGNVGYKEYKTGASGKATGFGGAALVAQRQAFKRAAAEFGLARGLYEK
jgi:hypothetical protein